MGKTRFYSLRWQISLFIILGALFFSGVTLWLTYRYVKKILTESLIEEGHILAQNISEIAAEKLVEDDVVALKMNIEKFKYLSKIEYILIEDSNNRIRTDTYNGDIPGDIPGSDYSVLGKTETFSVREYYLSQAGIRIYDITQPIKEGLLGFVRVGMKKSYIDDKIRETVVYLGAVFIVGTFLAIILAIFIVTLQVSRPIAYLTEQASKISMGEFEKPVKLRVKNEIGVLGEAIERMRESLKTSIERLRKR